MVQEAGKEGEREELPERWSAQRKAEIVLRLLRGEDLGEVSREIQVSPPVLEEWRRVFLESGITGLRRRTGDRGRAEEALEARRAVSPATGRRYPLTMVCEVYRTARSGVYAARGGREDAAVIVRKRGPRTLWSDEQLVEAIRSVLRESPFLGEGHRKVRVRLRMRGIRVGKNRVLRLLRENALVAPVRRRHPHGDRTHSSTIRTTRPNELWGTDATRFYTQHQRRRAAPSAACRCYPSRSSIPSRVRRISSNNAGATLAA